MEEEKIQEAKKLIEDASHIVNNHEFKKRRLDTNTEMMLGAIIQDESYDESIRCDSKKALFMANYGVAIDRAMRYFTKSRGIAGQSTLEDCEQAALEGLWHAICLYNGKNRLSSYAVWWIRQRLQRMSTAPRGIDTMNFNEADPMHVSAPSQYTQSYDGVDREEIFPHYYAADASTSVLDEDMSSYIEKRIQELPFMQREVIRGIENGETKKSVMERLGIKSSRYALVKGMAFDAIRKAYEYI